jgi:hypothetical protein
MKRAFLNYLGLAPTSASRPSTQLEITIGRLLAVCAHPVIAWRRLSPSARLVVCGGYAAAAYAVVLVLLMMRHPTLRF